MSKQDEVPIIDILLKEIDEAQKQENELLKTNLVSELVGNACLDIAGMESVKRALFIQLIAKHSRLSKATIEAQVKEKEKLIEPRKKVFKGEVDERFKKPELLGLIAQELDKKHKLDDIEKLALFIIRATAELPRPEDRCSVALKGDSASGKDNISKTILEHYPPEDSFFLTRGTQSALEEEASKVKCIAFSEINKHRDNGANNELTEFFKQLSEGGVKVIRRDQNTHEVVTIETEQKTLFYGTTETESDEELETRYVILPIKGSRKKNQIVVRSHLKKLTSLKNYDEGESWIAKSIRALKPYEVIIPYAEAVEECFDLNKERVKRDVKRIFSLSKAITWLYQEQRKKITEGSREALLSEPSDFITATELFQEFFNTTYEGFDHRYEIILKAIKDRQGKDSEEILRNKYPIEYSDWSIKNNVIDETGINRETFKTRLKWLKDENYVKTFFNREINGQISLLQVGEQVGVKSVIVGDTPTYTHLITHFITDQNLDELYENKEFEGVIYKEYINDEKKGRDISAISPTCVSPGEKHQDVSPRKISKNVLSYIKKEGEVDYNSLKKLNPQITDELLEQMKTEGLLYEPRSGFLKVV